MVGRSKVWRLARFTDDTRVEVECSLCPVKIKYVGNTTNIARHLELRHPAEFAALDPMAGAGGGVGGGGITSRHHHYQTRQPHMQREEAAICRILAQHQEELKRQETRSPTKKGTTITPNIKIPNITMPTKVWTWHIPVQVSLGQDSSQEGSFECSEFSLAGKTPAHALQDTVPV
ncbi:hypothetical protein Pmani_014385 [Petrolisthes manimaculis]|uniref:BED-type domain-containing protein n=1 Tax=Petrolisthes manimaculis TaxID=1843537 RepID=A0AAE1PWK1_9EUCA|nr:hypothetical protein Pmani_021591 [Petrolisthes manimaculis]KAK4314317.1 hypothetical protein Pmani_014385 [Petrolisthes manimaculis]